MFFIVNIRKNEKLVKIGVTKVVSVVSVVSQSESRTAQFCVEATEHFLFHYLFISKLYSLNIHVFYREYTKKWKIGRNRGHKSGRHFLCQSLRVNFFSGKHVKGMWDEYTTEWCSRPPLQVAHFYEFRKFSWFFDVFRLFLENGEWYIWMIYIFRISRRKYIF